MKALLRRLAGLFRRHRDDEAFRNELEANLQLHIDENMRAGLSPEEARRQALVKFGGIAATTEAVRDRRGIPVLDGAARDARLAFRLLLKTPMFTAIAVLTLGVGIGANATVFTIAYGALKGLPFRNADKIVYISEVDRSRPPRGGPAMVSYPDLLDIKQQSRSVEDLATFGIGTYNISDNVTTPERVVGSRVTMNFFSLVGQKPLLGRDFLSNEDQPGAEPVAIIGYGLWQSRYSGSPEVSGRLLRVNGVTHKIIGVMPRGMKFPVFSEIWLPGTPASPASLDRGARNIEVFARLRAGVSLQQAEADLDAIAERLEAEYPGTNKNIEIHAKPFTEQFDNPRNRNATWALIAAVCFVLLIVCANLANLLLARAIGRTRETAIRIAIGATRWQIVRQLLMESLALSFAGGLLGLFLAMIGFHGLLNLAEATGVLARLPFWMTFSFDYHVYIYLAVVCVVTGVLFGLTPAMQISRTDANEKLKDASAAAGVGVRSSRLMGILVTAEIALTFTLLVAAGLMIRSLVRFQTVDTDPNMLVGSLVLSGSRYSQPGARVSFLGSLIEQLQSRPGLASVTAATEIPGAFAWREIHTHTADLSEVATAVVMPGYFTVVGAKILRGRDFEPRDGAMASPVAIVNAQFASQQWAGEDAIGKRIRKGSAPEAPWLTIIGIVSNLRVEDSEEPQPVVYTPYGQEPVPSVVLIARSELPRNEVARTLRTQIQTADPDLPLFNVMTMDDFQTQIGLPLRIFVYFFSVFGALALLVSVMGVYAVTAYAVSQRTREIGIRITFGATGRSVIWLVLRQCMGRLLIGLALGLIGAFGISRALAGMLFHTASTDVLTYAIISMAFLGALLAACLIPCSRTARVDPATFLRSQ